MITQQRKPVDVEKVMELTRELLIAIGEDPEREGLVDTPRRVAGFWKEFIDFDPGEINATFREDVDQQLISVSGIQVWSLCEHHLIPFSAEIDIDYMPYVDYGVKGIAVLGLSKFARIAHMHAHKLQVQERLTDDIAQTVREITATQNVRVTVRGRHLCMCMRGIRTDGVMTTVAKYGMFRP